MVLCAAVVALTYPVTRKKDYIKNSRNSCDISRFHCGYPALTEQEETRNREDKALQTGFDSHFVAVRVDKGYQAAAKGEVADYHELVLAGVHILPLVKVEFATG